MPGSTTELRLILNAVDKASGNIGQVAGAIGKLGKTGQATGDFMAGLGLNFHMMINPAMMAGQAVMKFAQFASDREKETVMYAEQGRDLARALGIGAEEASALIQFGDDLKIDMGTIKIAFRTALREGVLPTVDGLKDLQKEYKLLTSPTEKAQ